TIRAVETGSSVGSSYVDALAYQPPYVWLGAAHMSDGHRHSGTDARNAQRARRVTLACEVVSEDHITRSKTARGAISDLDFHLPLENENVLSSGCGVPIAETAVHEIGIRLKRNVVVLLAGRGRSSKWVWPS